MRFAVRNPLDYVNTYFECNVVPVIKASSELERQIYINVLRKNILDYVSTSITGQGQITADYLHIILYNALILNGLESILTL